MSRLDVPGHNPLQLRAEPRIWRPDDLTDDATDALSSTQEKLLLSSSSLKPSTIFTKKTGVEFLALHGNITTGATVIELFTIYNLESLSLASLSGLV